MKHARISTGARAGSLVLVRKSTMKEPVHSSAL